MRQNKTYKQTKTKYQKERQLTLTFIFGILSLVFILSTYSAASDYIMSNKKQETPAQAITATSTTTTLKTKDMEIIALPSIYNNEVEFQIRTIAAAQGFKWPDYLVRLAMNESSLNPNAISKPNKNGSRDYGLFQFNDKMPPIAITKACAMSLECATLKAIEAINSGQQHHWTQNEISKRK